MIEFERNPRGAAQGSQCLRMSRRPAPNDFIFGSREGMLDPRESVDDEYGESPGGSRAGCVKFISRLLQWCEPGTIDPTNKDRVNMFFERRFEIIGQVPCKHVQTALLDAIFRKRTLPPVHEQIDRKRSLYTRKQKDQPDFWPQGVPYECSFKLSKKDRLKLLPHLFALPLNDYAEYNAIIEGRKYGAKWDTWGQLLSSLDTEQMDLHDRDRTDNENNERRHKARMKVLRELISCAKVLEDVVNQHRSMRRADTLTTEPTPIPYNKVPSDVGLTRGVCERDLTSVTSSARPAKLFAVTNRQPEKCNYDLVATHSFDRTDHSAFFLYPVGLLGQGEVHDQTLYEHNGWIDPGYHMS